MNRKKTYHYDPETCSFEEVEPSWREWGAYIGQIVGLAVILTGFAVWGLDVQWVSTPQEQTLKVENAALERQLEEVNDRMTVLSDRLDTLAEKDRTLYRRLFQMNPISDDVRQVGVGGAMPHRGYEEMGANAQSLLRTTTQKLDKLERQVNLQKTSYRELYRIAKERQERLQQLPAIRPANGHIISGYGMRHHPILEVRKMHAGVDFLLQKGSPVMATANGTVERAERDPSLGNVVEIRHPEAEYLTRYAHLSEIPDGIYRGVDVQRGDTIGYSGNSGLSTGPHLHYEVRTLDDEALDPMKFFVPDMSPESFFELEERTRQYRANNQRGATAAGPLAAR